VLTAIAAFVSVIACSLAEHVTSSVRLDSWHCGVCTTGRQQSRTIGTVNRNVSSIEPNLNMAVTVFAPAIHVPAQFSLIRLGFSEVLLPFPVNMSQPAKFLHNGLEKLADVRYAAYGPYSLIWSWVLDAVDDEEIDWTALGFQLESKLFRQRCEDRWSIGRSSARIRRHGLQALRSPAKLKVKHARQTGAIDNHSVCDEVR
jgi:hypothetical protein